MGSVMKYVRQLILTSYDLLHEQEQRITR